MIYKTLTQRWVALRTYVPPGAKSVTSLGSEPKAHASTRKVFSMALSPKAVVELQPIVEASFEKRVLQWAKFAESGEVSMKNTTPGGYEALMSVC